MLTPEDQNYTLSRNVAKKPTHTALQTRKAKISIFPIEMADGKRDTEPNDSCRLFVNAVVCRLSLQEHTCRLL